MTNRDIKLVVTDMDKTLINDEGIISQRNIEAIRELKRRNIKFAVATGRSKHSLYNFLGRYGLEGELDYVISMNGVSLYDRAKDESFDFGYLEGEVIREVYSCLSSHDISFAVHHNRNILCSKRTKYTDIECEINGYEPLVAEDFTSVLEGKYPKLMLIGERQAVDTVEDILSKLEKRNFNFFRSFEFFLEIVKTGVSKGDALVKLCELSGIDISSVMSIGDNLNDLEMIKVSGHGVAVENAHGELKKHAVFVSKSNNEDGFAHACEVMIRKRDG